MHYMYIGYHQTSVQCHTIFPPALNQIALIVHDYGGKIQDLRIHQMQEKSRSSDKHNHQNLKINTVHCQLNFTTLATNHSTTVFPTRRTLHEQRNLECLVQKPKSISLHAQVSKFMSQTGHDPFKQNTVFIIIIHSRPVGIKFCHKWVPVSVVLASYKIHLSTQ